MIKALFYLVALLSVGCKQRRGLALENLALRQQLALFNLNQKRLQLRRTDRLFWAWISRFWERWRESLIVVKPNTVVRWHWKGFALYWTWLSKRNRCGRPGTQQRGQGVNPEDGGSESLMGHRPRPRNIL
jgi:putative transposase